MNYVHKSKEQLAQELETLRARIQELEADSSYSALERLLIELQERNEILDIFTRVVTFDIKNALGFIGSFSKTLVDMYPAISEERVRRYLHAIMERAERASTVVDELLLLDTVYQVDSPPLQLLAMDDAVAASLDQISNLIAVHQAEIVLPHSWPAVLGQAVLVQQLWALYIGDLLRYGGDVSTITLGYEERTFTGLPGHSCQLAIYRSRRYGKSADEAQPVARRKFWVCADSSSLSADQLAQAFQKYASLETTIVQHIMDKLNGCAGIEAQGDCGRLFFTLPIATPESEAEESV